MKFVFLICILLSPDMTKNIYSFVYIYIGALSPISGPLESADKATNGPDELINRPTINKSTKM